MPFFLKKHCRIVSSTTSTKGGIIISQKTTTPLKKMGPNTIRAVLGKLRSGFI
jgi:hypothetical protein